MRKTVPGAEIATRFVNLNEKTVGDFLRDYGKGPRLTSLDAAGKTWLAGFARNLREAWDKKKWSTAEQNIEQVFADRLSANLDRQMHGLKPGETRHFPYPDKYTKFERAAFRIRMGQERPAFEPRDILDEIARTILKASAHGLLRMCKGHSQGWPCPQPYLVADEQRRAYCYRSCGDQAKSEAKKLWHEEHPSGKKSKKRRTRAARR